MKYLNWSKWRFKATLCSEFLFFQWFHFYFWTLWLYYQLPQVCYLFLFQKDRNWFYLSSGQSAQRFRKYLQFDILLKYRLREEILYLVLLELSNFETSSSSSGNKFIDRYIDENENSPKSISFIFSFSWGDLHRSVMSFKKDN